MRVFTAMPQAARLVLGMCFRRNGKRTEREGGRDLIVRFSPPSEGEQDSVKTLRHYLYGPQKPERTADD